VPAPSDSVDENAYEDEGEKAQSGRERIVLKIQKHRRSTLFHSLERNMRLAWNISALPHPSIGPVQGGSGPLDARTRPLECLATQPTDISWDSRRRRSTTRAAGELSHILTWLESVGL
jgi:hypothetical protein